MRRALVTGGAGFIGSNLVNRLIDMGIEVTVVDDLSTGKRENIHPDATFHEIYVSPQLQCNVVQLVMEASMECFIGN